jgi:hypothetical protein
MRAPTFLTHWLASRRKPQVSSDGGSNNEVGGRGGRYGESYVLPLWPNDQMLADEGSYVTATMLPGATALQHGILAAFDATKAVFAFQNTDAPQFDGAVRCYLRYLKFNVITPPTSGTALRFASVLDPGNRQPTTISSGSGGTGPGTPATATAYRAPGFNVSLDESAGAKGAPYFPLSAAGGLPFAVPAPTQQARTVVGNGSLRAQIPVAGDEYTIQFGAADFPGGALVTAAPAGASRIVIAHPPVVIPPQAWFLLHLWAPGNITAGIAFDGLEAGWGER